MKENKKISDILTEYKALYDSGVITEEEYNAKKESLLKELEENKDEPATGNEEKIMPKQGIPNYFVIGICVGALLLGASAVFSITNLLSNKKKNENDVIAKDEVKFGMYPQEYIKGDDLKDPSEQTSDDKKYVALKKALMKTVDDLPKDSENPNGWTSFKFYDYQNYFDEESLSMKQKTVQADYYWYKDFKYNNEMYRATYSTRYRDRTPFKTTVTFIDKSENIYYTNLVYFFKFKPLVWRKLEKKENGYTYLMSSRIIDYCDYEPRTIDLSNPDQEKPNNYKGSKIREWLNADFFATAFSETNVAKMEVMEVDNSVASTLDQENKFACENTNDYVSLLSKKELFNSQYNISSEERRALKVTDYASSFVFTDLYNSSTGSAKYGKGKTSYWLRTPSSETAEGNAEGLRASLVYPMGEATVTTDQPTYFCDYGVVPTISVKL